MNVYDFDGTIYANDSTRDLYYYLLLHKPKVVKYLPMFCCALVRYVIGNINKTELKTIFFKYLKCFKEGEIEKIVEDFWDKNENKICDWYKNQKKQDDVVISASPRFLLEPICKRLAVGKLICSEVNKLNGKFDGLNCYGEEKVPRFYKEYPNGEIDEFYSDSKSDTPMASCAKKAYLVKGTSIKHEF